jgi:transcriptional regulator with XRE-family HTH domain
MLTELGKFLRKLRIDLFISLRKMSNDIGISATYLSQIETGERKPNLDLLEKIKIHYNFTEAQYKEMINHADNSHLDKKHQFEHFAIARSMRHFTPEETEKVRKLIEELNKPKTNN